MADDKLNTGPKDNAPPESTASPGTIDLPSPERSPSILQDLNRR